VTLRDASSVGDLSEVALAVYHPRPYPLLSPLEPLSLLQVLTMDPDDLEAESKQSRVMK
jgi:hypothetical protein